MIHSHLKKKLNSNIINIIQQYNYISIEKVKYNKDYIVANLNLLNSYKNKNKKFNHIKMINDCEFSLYEMKIVIFKIID
jgi:mannitol-specific phosphotransferase system IIBC component